MPEYTGKNPLPRRLLDEVREISEDVVEFQDEAGYLFYDGNKAAVMLQYMAYFARRGEGAFPYDNGHPLNCNPRDMPPCTSFVVANWVAADILVLDVSTGLPRIAGHYIHDILSNHKLLKWLLSSGTGFAAGVSLRPLPPITPVEALPTMTCPQSLYQSER